MPRLALLARPARRRRAARRSRSRGPGASSSALGPEGLAQHALDPVALDRAAELAAHRHARAAGRRPRPGAGTRRRPGSGWRGSGPRGRRARTRRCATAAGAFDAARRRPSALGAEPPAALAAPALEDVPAGARAHARAEPVGAGALALLGLVGALHRRGRPKYRERRGHRSPELFPRFARAPLRRPLGAARENACARLASPRAADSLSTVPSPPMNSPRPAPREGLACPCPNSSSRSGSASRADLRREVPDFQFHIWLEPLELAGARRRHRSTSARPSTSAPGSASATCRSCAAAATRVLGARGRGRDRRRGLGAAPAAEARAAAAPRAGLNPKYTFEQFVIGDGNRFAHAAALAVAELPAQAYNPLFIHGRPGLGKTHLLHAIGNYVERYGSGLRVRYATIEDFTREFVEAVRGGSTAAFKDGFRKADVVLIDDVQFLARGERHPRGVLPHLQRAVRVRPPARDHLRPPPDRARRDRGAAERALPLRARGRARAALASPCGGRSSPSAPASTGSRSATRSSTRSPLRVDSQRARARGRADPRRRLRLAARRASPTSSPARKVLDAALPMPGRRSSREIVDATASAFGLAADELRARDRRPDVAFARQVAMFLARELTDHSLPDIGRELGGRNHTHRPPRRRPGRAVDSRTTRLSAPPSTSSAASSAPGG